VEKLLSEANALAAAAAAASVYPVHQDPLQEQADVNGYAQRQQNRHTKQVQVSFKIANVECLKNFLLCDRGDSLHLVDTKMIVLMDAGRGFRCLLILSSYLFLLLIC
jgi:hypothetical protein